MKLAILGATGTVGRELVTQALAAGHKVTALVREQPQPDEIDGRVALVVGDATNVDAVNSLVEGSDSVVSALGHVNGAPDDLLACTSANLITTMRADGVDRLVVLSSPAVDDPEDRPGLFYRAARVLLRIVMPSVVRDHRAQARLIEESGLAWTIVRGPLLFTDGPHTGHYHAGAIGRDSGPRISRADLADFMLTTATNGSFIRMTTAGEREGATMLPLSDGLHPRHFPIVNVTLIAANFAVWLLYELPHLNTAIYHASFYACTVDHACRGPEPWGISWFTAMFMHGSWDHILGNMLFLAIFGKNVEDAFGHLRYLAFYIAGGFAATMAQAAVTLLFGTEAAARVPNLGASGAIAAVLGAFIVLYPAARIRTLVLIFFVKIPAWVYLGGWFLYQLAEAHLGLTSASANGGGVAFFAHVGGFVFGAAVTVALLNAGRVVPQSTPPRRPAVGVL